jgi:hypothetical protein
MDLGRFAPGPVYSPASLCGEQAGRQLARNDPAEPDDPNSSSPNPNKQKNWGWAGFEGV